MYSAGLHVSVADSVYVPSLQGGLSPVPVFLLGYQICYTVECVLICVLRQHDGHHSIH